MKSSGRDSEVTRPLLDDENEAERRDVAPTMVRTDNLNQNDRFNLVYLILVLQGVGTLLPWNMFITAHAYFLEKFKMNTALEHSFENYFSVAAMVPNVLMFLLNTLFKHKFSLNARMLTSLFVMIIMFILTTTLVKVDTSGWTNRFFFVTIGTIVCINMVSAVYQGGLFGLSGMLPPKYTGAVMTGQGIGGSFAAVASILSLLGGKGPIESGFGYFLSAVVVLFLCFVSYLMLFKLEFARHHLGLKKTRTEVTPAKPTIQSSRLANWQVPVPQSKKTMNRSAGSFSRSTLSLDANSYLSPQLESRDVQLIKKDRPPFFLIFRQISKFALSVMLVFFVTLAAFPSLTSRIQSKQKGDGSGWTTTYFVPVTCFLLFNLGDFGGRLAASFVQWPKPGGFFLPLLCIIRVVFLPLFAFCNAQPRPNQTPVFFHDDWYPIIFMIVFAISNGYLGSLCMMYGPSCVEARHAETAGTMMAFFLVIGLGLGAGFSFVITLNL